jgi:hypothetical protein
MFVLPIELLWLILPTCTSAITLYCRRLRRTVEACFFFGGSIEFFVVARG